MRVARQAGKKTRSQRHDNHRRERAATIVLLVVNRSVDELEPEGGSVERGEAIMFTDLHIVNIRAMLKIGG